MSVLRKHLVKLLAVMMAVGTLATFGGAVTTATAQGACSAPSCRGPSGCVPNGGIVWEAAACTVFCRNGQYVCNGW
jgi:hypothetical protein